MDVFSAVSGYISKMVTTGDTAGTNSSSKMKILLLDSETVGDATPFFLKNIDLTGCIVTYRVNSHDAVCPP